LHKPGLTVSPVPLRTSAGYLIFVAKDFASIILLNGCLVSEWLPSFSGTLSREWPHIVGGLSSARRPKVKYLPYTNKGILVVYKGLYGRK